jgi:hypothetical protein
VGYLALFFCEFFKIIYLCIAHKRGIMLRSITYFFVLSFFFSVNTEAQINAYAKITAISNGSVLTVSNLNQAFGNFIVGGDVVVMQMQGASITGNTSDNSSFGNLTAINSVGLYEVGTILSINGASTTITLTKQLSNSYTPADALQLISYPKLGTTSFATTSNMTAVAWDGNRGGVLAFYVTGNLSIGHNISVNTLGFRGGAKAGQDGSGCETATFRIATGNAKYADKGESVYLTTNSQKSGRGKSVNGGGGGIVHNGGGAGGGNITAGGDGYYGYTGSGYCSITTNAGGIGGAALSGSSTRIFMGGGGGGGQENDGLGSTGGAGGGIVLIKCDTIVITGACSGRSITANGGSVTAGAGNDGQGGGGAGGSIVLDIKGMRVVASCPFTVAANGGAGGSVGNSTPHGAGGGGGQGAIYIRATAPFTNVSLTTLSGPGGNASTGGSPPTGGSGGGTSGTGVVSGSGSIPLPIELLEFFAEPPSDVNVYLHWSTASEKNSKSFELQATKDFGTWETIANGEAMGTTDIWQKYSATHKLAANERYYYRLKQIDLDGKYTYSWIITNDLRQLDGEFQFFPNPSSDHVFVSPASLFENERFVLIDMYGKAHGVSASRTADGKMKLTYGDLPNGIYHLNCSRFSQRIVISN